VHYAVSAQLALTPFHWNYAPAVASLTIVFGTAVACLRRGRRTGSGDGDGDGDGEAARTAPVGTRRAYALAVEALPVLVLLADLVVAGRHGLPWEESAISTNWALPGQYAAVGADLRGRGTVIGSPGEIGTLAFFCRCDIVDAFSDRGVVLPLIRQQEDRSGPVGRRFLRLNFQHLDDGQRPASPDEVLVHRPEPPRGADSWPVRSSWRGAGSLTLEKR
jgi:hypothetical protein